MSNILNYKLILVFSLIITVTMPVAFLFGDDCCGDVALLEIQKSLYQAYVRDRRTHSEEIAIERHGVRQTDYAKYNLSSKTLEIYTSRKAIIRHYAETYLKARGMQRLPIEDELHTNFGITISELEIKDEPAFQDATIAIYKDYKDQLESELSANKSIAKLSQKFMAKFDLCVFGGKVTSRMIELYSTVELEQAKLPLLEVFRYDRSETASDFLLHTMIATNQETESHQVLQILKDRQTDYILEHLLESFHSDINIELKRRCLEALQPWADEEKIIDLAHATIEKSVIPALKNTAIDLLLLSSSLKAFETLRALFGNPKDIDDTIKRRILRVSSRHLYEPNIFRFIAELALDTQQKEEFRILALESLQGARMNQLQDLKDVIDQLRGHRGLTQTLIATIERLEATMSELEIRNDPRKLRAQRGKKFTDEIKRLESKIQQLENTGLHDQNDAEKLELLRTRLNSLLAAKSAASAKAGELEEALSNLQTSEQRNLDQINQIEKNLQRLQIRYGLIHPH